MEPPKVLPSTTFTEPANFLTNVPVEYCAVVEDLPEIKRESRIFPAVRRSLDRTMIEKMLASYGLDGRVLDTFRMGKFNDFRPRPLKVIFANSHMASNFISSFNTLGRKILPAEARYVIVRRSDPNRFKKTVTKNNLPVRMEDPIQEDRVQANLPSRPEESSQMETDETLVPLTPIPQTCCTPETSPNSSDRATIDSDICEVAATLYLLVTAVDALVPLPPVPTPTASIPSAFPHFEQPTMPPAGKRTKTSRIRRPNSLLEFSPNTTSPPRKRKLQKFRCKPK